MGAKIPVIMILLIMIGSTFVSAVNIKSDDYFEEVTPESEIIEKQPDHKWKRYPLDIQFNSISFPKDEGRHDPIWRYPVEWWYVNFRLIGGSTGKEYGAFVAFFKTPQIRYFSISDLDINKTFTNQRFGFLTSSKGKLDLTFLSLFTYDRWYTKTEGGDIVPFNYKLMVSGDAQEGARKKMELNVDMNCIKPPMLIGGDGLVKIGTGWSYYYSQTKIEVSGDIKVNGVTEPVTGYAWMDHQWGLFDFDIYYEWFSIKLDDFREIMVGDTFWRFNGEHCGSFSDGLNLFNADSSFEIMEQYTITQLGFWTDPVNRKKFSNKWRITEPSKQIDLIVTPDYNNQVMNNYYIRSWSFWEGSCSVSGTIEGEQVNGKAYVELTQFWN